MVAASVVAASFAGVFRARPPRVRGAGSAGVSSAGAAGALFVRDAAAFEGARVPASLFVVRTTRGTPGSES